MLCQWYVCAKKEKWCLKMMKEKLFEELNSYTQNIEVNPTTFLDTELVRENGEITTQVFSKSISYLCTGVQKLLLDISTMLSLGNYMS